MLHPALPVAPCPRASLPAPSHVSFGSPNLAPNAVVFDPDCPAFLPATHYSHQLSACCLQRSCSEIGEALFCIYLISIRIQPMRFVLFFAKSLTHCACCSIRIAWRKWCGTKDVTTLHHWHLPLASHSCIAGGGCLLALIHYRMPPTWPRTTVSNPSIPRLSGWLLAPR
jgi:hypothetical protein